MKGTKRRAIPVRIKRLVRARQGGKCGCRAHCGAILPPDGKGLVQYQHFPALGIRPINEAGTDWDPPQHDPDHIYAELAECHKRETYEGRNGAYKIGSDRYEIDKMRRHESKKVKRRRSKLQSRPGSWPKRKTKWPKRSMRKKA